MIQSLFFIATTALKFLLSLSLIVSIHELGHLLWAKLFGIRVSTYMVGLPPKIFSVKKGDTEYGIGALPLGGYVQIEGFAEEEEKEGKEKNILEKWAFGAKAAWKRLLVILGGVIFNFSSAILLFALLNLFVGSPYIPKDAIIKHGIEPTELGYQVGFLKGDKIVKINGKDYEKLDELHENLHRKQTNYYTVSRKGKMEKISVSSKISNDILKTNQLLFNPLIPYSIKEVSVGSPAQRGKLQAGDVIISVNGKPTRYVQELMGVLGKINDKQEVLIKYERNHKIYTTKIQTSEKGKLGISLQSTLKTKTQKSAHLGLALIESCRTSQNIIIAQLRGIKSFVVGKSSISQSISGPIGIAKLFGKTNTLMDILRLIAILSLLIGFMNLLPIPGLDGFHAFILLIEVVRRKPLNRRIRRKLQKIGGQILLLLMLLALLNDFYKLIMGH